MGFAAASVQFPETAFDLERKVLNDIAAGRHVQLERALLILSGLRTEREIAGYIEKLDRLQEGFRCFCGDLPNEKYSESEEPVRKARNLFRYLWFKNKKDKRSSESGRFLLTDAIDGQLSRDKSVEVGSCLGLTALYNVLGVMEGLNLNVVFGRANGGHIYSRLRDDREYDIENTNKNGFDIRQKNVLEVCELSSLFGLSIATLSNRLSYKIEKGDYHGAIEDATKELEITPVLPLVFNTLLARGEARQSLGDITGARADYQMAKRFCDEKLKTSPDSRWFYFYRGQAKVNLWRTYDEGLRLSEKALAELADARQDLKSAVAIESGFLTPDVQKMLDMIGKLC